MAVRVAEHCLFDYLRVLVANPGPNDGLTIGVSCQRNGFRKCVATPSHGRTFRCTPPTREHGLGLLE